jgi:hypothetical protein
VVGLECSLDEVAGHFGQMPVVGPGVAADQLVGGATATRKAAPWCWPLVSGLSVFSALCLIAHWASWPRPGAGGAGHSAIEQRSSGLDELRPEAPAGHGVGLYLGILATAVAAGASFLAVRAQRDTDGRTNHEQSR